MFDVFKLFPVFEVKVGSKESLDIELTNPGMSFNFMQVDSFEYIWVQYILDEVFGLIRNIAIKLDHSVMMQTDFFLIFLKRKSLVEHNEENDA